MLQHIIEDLKRRQAGIVGVADASAQKMANEAKRKASWTDRTGNTRNAIHGRAAPYQGGAMLVLAHGSKVGMYHEEGTGIYGPKGKPITPVNAKVLHFKVDGQSVFTKSVKGIPKNPVLKNAAMSQLPELLKALEVHFGGR